MIARYHEMKYLYNFFVVVSDTDAVDNVFNDLCGKIIILLLLMRQKCVLVYC